MLLLHVKWIVSPLQYESGAAFTAAFQRLDLKSLGVIRYIYTSNAEVGDLVNYEIKVDLVYIGNDDRCSYWSNKITFTDLKGGDDTFVVPTSQKKIAGGAGDDNIDGGAGDDIINDSQGNNTLTGGVAMM